MAAPSSQKASDRPISFYLTNSQNSAVNASVTLNIRPEDLRRTEPGLLTPTQTLNGAFIDDFGPGLQQIAIAGTTGWRGSADADGGQLFVDLRDTVWVQWHALRAQAVANGQVPDTIKLIFVDTLDSIVAQVAPGQFSLARNRSRPLLYQYSLVMTVIADNLDVATVDTLSLNPDGSSSSPDQMTLGLESLANSIDTLSTLAPQAALYLPGSASAISGLMSNGASILGSVVSAATATAAALAAPVAAASRNLLWAYTQASGLTGLQALPLLQAASAFENAACVLTNVFSGALSYTDLSSLFGASVCSSTLSAGGLSPYLGANPFETISEPADLPLSISTSGQAALLSATQLDPVLGSFSTASLTTTAAAINAGVAAT